MTGSLARSSVGEAAASVAATFADHALEADRNAEFPLEDVTALRSSGLFGLMVPERLGGPGTSFAEYVAVAMTLAGGSPASALVFNMHASVTGALALTPDDLARGLGAPESYFDARDALLRDTLDGAFYAVAMSERTSGAKLSAISTTYESTGSRFLIKGSKAFVSGARLADAYLVAARSARDAKRVSYFIVPAGAGIEVETTWDVLGMRGTGSHDVHFETAVGPNALLGGVEGLALLIASLMPQWLVASYAAVYVGVARRAISAAVADVSARSLDTLPMVRSRIGRADAAVAAAELAVADAASRIDRAPGAPETNRAVYRAKLLAGETATEVAGSMLEAAGASATRRGNLLERLYRDARCGSLQPATSDVCADWLGLAALGRDPNSSEV
ncbi:MAG TPA: acyl-CoA dehydrogenase family protein, partial [Acidimicrobiales bacterium]|nr:acyl-CoA dehydrogenase family protein [Acidimicrobiales bacterium]